MDQILENSYFRTNNKNKYSFPKSNRFPQLKANYTIDYLDVSSIRNKTRSTSFGYGSKYDFMKNVKIGPSPSQYSIEYKKQSKRGISFGFSRQNVKTNSYIDPQKIKTPRVGEYNADFRKTIRKEPSYFMGIKNSNDSFIRPNHIPAPNQYSSSHGLMTKTKSTSKFGFGSSKRFQNPQIQHNNAIGPGSYSSLSRFESKYGKIGQAIRKTYAVQQTQKSCSPGPKYILK